MDYDGIWSSSLPILSFLVDECTPVEHLRLSLSHSDLRISPLTLQSTSHKGIPSLPVQCLNKQSTLQTGKSVIFQSAPEQEKRAIIRYCYFFLKTGVSFLLPCTELPTLGLWTLAERNSPFFFTWLFFFIFCHVIISLADPLLSHAHRHAAEFL